MDFPVDNQLELTDSFKQRLSASYESSPARAEEARCSQDDILSVPAHLSFLFLAPAAITADCRASLHANALLRLN